MKKAVLALVLLISVDGAFATVFMTQQQALDSAFGAGVSFRRETFFLTADQVKLASKLSSVEKIPQHVVRYVGTRGGRGVGYVYFDAHRVRSLPETLMIVVTPAGKIEKIDIVSFSEPAEYMPKRRWLDQLHRRKLDSELSLSRAIRPISGATLSGRAIVDASRKMLAIHEIITPRAASAGSVPAAR